MMKVTELVAIMVVFWASTFVLACAFTVALSHHGPTQFLYALYAGVTGMLAASWAAGVAVPIGVPNE